MFTRYSIIYPSGQTTSMPNKAICWHPGTALEAQYGLIQWPLAQKVPLPCHHMGLLADTQKCGLHMRRECLERFPRHRLQRKPLVSDPGMHHGTCVTQVPWCMSGSLTRSGGENVPGIPGACATRNFAYLVRGPCRGFPQYCTFERNHRSQRAGEAKLCYFLQLLNKRSSCQWCETSWRSRLRGLIVVFSV